MTRAFLFRKTALVLSIVLIWTDTAWAYPQVTVQALVPPPPLEQKQHDPSSEKRESLPSENKDQIVAIFLILSFVLISINFFYTQSVFVRVSSIDSLTVILHSESLLSGAKEFFQPMMNSGKEIMITMDKTALAWTSWDCLGSIISLTGVISL